MGYAHTDLAFLKRLLVHLRPLERAGRISVFSDRSLKAGDDWRRAIEKSLKTARIAILLVSADFLASDFIIDNELPPLLDNAAIDGTRIIPVIVKPCRFTRDHSLSQFQAINSPDRAVIEMDEGEQERIYDDIAREVERVVP